jgi:hypothetical protein
MTKRFVCLRQYSTLVALASLLWIAPSVKSQDVPARTPPITPPQSSAQDNDITTQELSNFDKFLDGHPEIAEQVRRNPSLLDDREYVSNHPELQAYLQDHPRVREEVKENPRAFMRDENRFDRKEADDRDREGNRDRDRDNDANRRELANFDAFLDKHPEIAEQLRKNPTLADNKRFLENHPALRQFMQEHPGVRQQMGQDPHAFMRQEDRFDQRAFDRRDRDNDVSRRELASFDGFLDTHPEVAAQLSKNPSLAKNEEFLENHPELREYLKTHTSVQQGLAENPQAFMNSMKQFDNSGTTKKQMADPKPKP